MELDEIEIVSLHPPQALFDTGPDVFRRMNVLGSHWSAWHAAAFRSKKIFAAAMGDETPD
jgi:hypothetical protein